MRFVRLLFEVFLLGLSVVAVQQCGWWALLIVPAILALGVYLDLEYFQAREHGELTFYLFRSRERKMEEFWKTAREAENKLLHRDN